MSNSSFNSIIHCIITSKINF